MKCPVHLMRPLRCLTRQTLRWSTLMFGVERIESLKFILSGAEGINFTILPLNFVSELFRLP